MIGLENIGDSQVQVIKFHAGPPTARPAPCARTFHLWIVWGLYLGVLGCPISRVLCEKWDWVMWPRAPPRGSRGWSNGSALHKFHHQQPVIPSEARGLLFNFGGAMPQYSAENPHGQNFYLPYAFSTQRL